MFSPNCYPYCYPPPSQPQLQPQFQIQVQPSQPPQPPPHHSSPRLQTVYQQAVDEDIVILDAPPTEPSAHYTDYGENVAITSLHHHPSFSTFDLHQDSQSLKNLTHQSQPSPIKRPASTPIPSSSGVPKIKRARLEIQEQYIDPSIFTPILFNPALIHEDKSSYFVNGDSSGSDDINMDLDLKLNSREYRRLALARFPPPSRGIIEPDEDSRIFYEEAELLRAMEFSTMYPRKHMALTDRELKEARMKTAAYNENLDYIDIPASQKELLKTRAKDRFELQISHEKVWTRLQKVQQERESRMSWTEVGLPPFEVVGFKGSKSMPNIKIVASVTTKRAQPKTKQKKDGECEEMSSQSSQMSLDNQQSQPQNLPSKRASFLARKARLSALITPICKTDPFAAERAAEEEHQKSQIELMLHMRSVYKITDRATTPPPLPGTREYHRQQRRQQNLNAPPFETDPTFLSQAHMQRYNHLFNKGTQNSLIKEQEIRSAIFRQHDQYAHEAAVKRKNDIWYTPDPPPPVEKHDSWNFMPPTNGKTRSWAGVSWEDRHFRTFSIEEIIDASPEQRWRFLEHNKLVGANGVTKEFEYERDDPFGKDPYFSNIPPEEDLANYV
ncbi:hypothetical protein TWF730_000325 [Orbilia blumenaviensis]|uniref:Uncharacterized protein n=1 Tax=Orbilia blumenaviensis TaxID=1796055 RepID=A0AAV9VN91_9PEZI